MVMIEEGDHYCDEEFTEIVAIGRSADVFGNNWDDESFYYVVTRKTQRVMLLIKDDGDDDDDFHFCMFMRTPRGLN